MTADPGRCDVCGHELVETEGQQGHLALGCPLCHAQRQAQVWRGEWEKVCREVQQLRQELEAARRERDDLQATLVRVRQDLETQWRCEQEVRQSLVAARATADEAAKTGVKYLQLYESATAGWAQANEELVEARAALAEIDRLERIATYERCPACDHPKECNRETGCLVVQRRGGTLVQKAARAAGGGE